MTYERTPEGRVYARLSDDERRALNGAREVLRRLWEVTDDDLVANVDGALLEVITVERWYAPQAPKAGE